MTPWGHRYAAPDRPECPPTGGLGVHVWPMFRAGNHWYVASGSPPDVSPRNVAQADCSTGILQAAEVSSSYRSCPYSDDYHYSIQTKFGRSRKITPLIQQANKQNLEHQNIHGHSTNKTQGIHHLWRDEWVPTDKPKTKQNNKKRTDWHCRWYNNYPISQKKKKGIYAFLHNFIFTCCVDNGSSWSVCVRR